MITSKQAITLSTESKFDSVSFILNCITAKDSMSGDSVEIEGVTRDALQFAILSYVRSCSGYHDGPEGEFIKALIKVCDKVSDLHRVSEI